MSRHPPPNCGLSVRARELIDALRSDLSRSPRELRRRALEVVNELVEADSGLWYQVGLVDGDPVPMRWEFLNAPSTVVMTRHRDERIPWPTGDPRLPKPHTSRRFALLQSLLPSRAREDFFATRLYERCWAPMNIVDQIRMVVYHQGRHVGWIGAGRFKGQPEFAQADLRRVRQAADAIADALVQADAHERTATPESGCDLLLTPDGLVEYASDAGRAMLAAPGIAAEIRAWARAADQQAAAPPPVLQGHRVRWARLTAESGRVRYLLHLEPIAPLRVVPGAALSRMQREVARLACAGATVKEIGEMLGIRPSTVRSHIKDAYTILHISSRAELARALAEMPPEPDLDGDGDGDGDD